jgi:hypothetical protein
MSESPFEIPGREYIVLRINHEWQLFSREKGLQLIELLGQGIIVKTKSSYDCDEIVEIQCSAPELGRIRFMSKAEIQEGLFKQLLES